MSDEFPKGAGRPDPKAEVQIILTEEWARMIEKQLMQPRDLHLAGPVVFSDDDLPTYIIGIGASR